MRFLILTFLMLGLFINSAAAQTKRPKKKTPVKQTSDKIIYEPDAEMLREMQSKVKVIESKQDWAKFDRQSPIVNPSKTRSAYVAQFKTAAETNATLDVIVIYDSATDKFYEISGIEDFPWRPFSDFKWISDDALEFDQWINPTNGGRYRVNVKTGKIVAAGYVRSN